MNEHAKCIVTRHRELNMFAELSHAHFVLLENVRLQRSGWVYECLSCNILAAFKFEAFLNHLGFKLFPENWDHKERHPYDKKLIQLTQYLIMTIDETVRPFETLTSIFKTRNSVAHGKPKIFHQDETFETGDIEELRRKKLLTEWESLCTIDFAERAYADTEQISNEMWRAAGYDVGDLRSRGHGYSLKPIT